MIETVYAEDVGNYWQTSRSGPDTWMERTKRQIEGAGGTVHQEAFGKTGGNCAYMMTFELGGEPFKVIWPVLPSKTGNERAAKIQAATMLFHDVKARCVTAKVLGARAAFFTYLMLPDGRTVGEMATPELMARVPDLLKGNAQIEPPVIEGEWREDAQ